MNSELKLEAQQLHLANYHTHTPRCLHARGTGEEFVEWALDIGYDTLGFTDHTPWPYTTDFVANMRMPMSRLDDYIEEIKALKERYAGRIRILLGLECEGFPGFYPWLDRIREEKELDYIILGNHFDTNDEFGGKYFGHSTTPEHLLRYMETTVAAMETGKFLYLAHPDLCLNTYKVLDKTAERVLRTICETAQRLNMPLEFNLLGLERGKPEPDMFGYTTNIFWQIASEYKINAIIGVDAHTPEALDRVQTYAKVRAKLEGMGINVLDHLDI